MRRPDEISQYKSCSFNVVFVLRRGKLGVTAYRSVTRSTLKFVAAALMTLAISAFAADPASVSGVVQDADHAPLMGAAVELFGSGTFPLLTAFTDTRGRYEFSNLAPGQYSVRVIAAEFLPLHGKSIKVEPSSRVVVNLTLVSLLGMSQWFPAVPRPADEPADDWKWTLRSGVDRPILRWIDDSDSGDSAARQPGQKNANRPVTGHAALTAGSNQFGEGGFRQEALLHVHENSSANGIVHLLTSSSGAAFLAGGVERSPGMGDTARATASFRTLPMDYGNGQSRLQILQVRGGEQLTLSDAVMAQFGAATEAVQAGQNATAALPFVAVHMQSGGNEISYQLATASDLQNVTDLAESSAVPAMSMEAGNLRLTHALHQEVSIQRSLAGVQMQAAFYYDHLVDPVLNGYGDGSAAEFASGDVLLDPITGAFRTAGPNYSGSGFRVFAARQIRGNVWSAVEFAEGPAIALPAANLLGGNSFADAVQGVATTRTESVLFSMHGRVAGTGTRWNAGYRWQPEQSITGVDPFNAGMNAPFFSVTLHQPVGTGNASPDRLELELVMQNILGQGYRPVYMVAGQTLYFAQAPRLITGGLAFSF